MERLSQQLLRLELSLIVLHLLRQVASTGFISRNKIDHQLSALLILSDYWELSWVVKHISESLCSKEAASDEGRGRGIPERVFFVGDFGNHSCFEVVFTHILDDVVTIRKGLWIPPVGIARILVDNLNHDRSFLEFNFLLFLVAIRQHHLH